MITKNQLGFSAIEALLILVIVALVAGTGFFVYRANSKTTSTLSQASTDSAASPQKVSKTSASQTQQPGADEAAAVTTAVKAYGDNASHDDLKVSVEHLNSTYAFGETQLISDSQGGSTWFAEKTNGKWSVTTQDSNKVCDQLDAHNLSDWEPSCHS